MKKERGQSDLGEKSFDQKCQANHYGQKVTVKQPQWWNHFLEFDWKKIISHTFYKYRFNAKISRLNEHGGEKLWEKWLTNQNGKQRKTEKHQPWIFFYEFEIKNQAASTISQYRFYATRARSLGHRWWNFWYKMSNGGSWGLKVEAGFRGPSWEGACTWSRWQLFLVIT